MGGENSPRSQSKSKVGEKRSSAQFGGKLERCKRVKMRDLDSVCRSEEMIESSRRFLSSDKEKSQEPLKDAATLLLEIAQTKLTSTTVPPVVEPGITSFDLNYEIRLADNSATMNHGATLDNSKGFSLNLNVNEKSTSPKEDPFLPLKDRKSGDVSECGSTNGALEEKDSMKVWKEMKQNGFLSSSHVSITVPNQRRRKLKNKSNGFKRKMELAKKEQVDKFVKIAAPSGLLNDLNPGIINHVRNRKQVHSIIEAIVRSERNENNQGVGKQMVLTRSYDKDDHISGIGITPLGVSHDGSLNTSSMSQRTGGSLIFGMEQLGKNGDSNKVERWFSDKSSCPLQKKQDRENDVLSLKLASTTTKAFEGISSLSNEDSANIGSVSSLSVKAASVAFEWLELLQQDITGRLAALQRSKKRVGSVLGTELPLLMSREFSGSQENDPHVVKNYLDGCSLSDNASAHRAKWFSLFDQMDKTLSEEEKQLEIWLHQIKKMQLQCGKGLHQFHQHPVRPGKSQNDHRLEEKDKLESDLAIRAAAASIYSTCNFLSSSENLPCY